LEVLAQRRQARRLSAQRRHLVCLALLLLRRRLELRLLRVALEHQLQRNSR
jgi:hypothetical protein